MTDLSDKDFEGCERAAKGKRFLCDAFDKAERAYLGELEKVTLKDLIEIEAANSNPVNWHARAEQMR